ncbi:MAG: hypothetical protein Q4G42_01000 [Neisseria sp.]|nr:hypothetical protein [Neisseria sp.]
MAFLTPHGFGENIMIKRLFLLSCTALLLAACSDNQQASDANLKSAIDAYNQAHPLCLPMSPMGEGFRGGVFGDPSIRIVRADLNGKSINKQALKQMEVLEKEGVYDRQKDEAGSAKARVAVFTLSDKGKGYFTGSATNPQLCIGTTRVKKIQWFSQPTAHNGLTVSRVAYEGEYELHKWAKKLLKAADSETPISLNQTVSAQTTLVQTNKGWLDIRELD